MSSTCGICKTSIEAYEARVFCSLCDTPYHYNHLQGWLINEDNCPSCRQELPREYRTSVNKNNPFREFQSFEIPKEGFIALAILGVFMAIVVIAAMIGSI